MLTILTSHEQSQYSPQHTFFTKTLEQYHNYLTLLRLTNNFQKKFEFYHNIDMNKYQGNMTIVGSVFSIEGQGGKYVCPVITTTVNQNAFCKRDETHLRATMTPIKRKLAIMIKAYKGMIKAFNKIINTSKKDKNQLYVFTCLKAYISPQGALFFGLTTKSRIAKFERQFYKSKLVPLEQSLTSNYSQLDLREVWKESLPNGRTFTLDEVRNKMTSTLCKAVFTGVIKEITNMKDKPNPKEQELVLEVLQDNYRQSYDSVGYCKIYLRYELQDQDNMLKTVQLDKACVFIIEDFYLNDNVQLNFRITHWKQCIIPLDQKNFVAPTLEQKFKKITRSMVSKLLEPVIYRNYYKMRLVKTDINFWYVRVLCKYCLKEGRGHVGITRTGEWTYGCRQCQKDVPAYLDGFMHVFCYDQSGYCQLKIDSELMLPFLNMQEEEPQIVDELLNMQTYFGQGQVLVKKFQDKNWGEWDDSLNNVKDKNAFLHSIVIRAQLAFVEKDLIVIPKVNTQDQAYKLEDVRNELQGSFVKMKEIGRKVPMFLNGHLMASEERTRLVPELRVFRIC